MGSIFKVPKYTPPAQLDTSNKLLDEREARVDAKEQKELRQIASKSRAQRKGGRLLVNQNRAIPMLGTGPGSTKIGRSRQGGLLAGDFTRQSLGSGVSVRNPRKKKLGSESSQYG